MKIKIELVIMQWNVIITMLNRFAMFSEVMGILGHLKSQIEGIGEVKPTDKLAIELTVDEFNYILTIIKTLPMYDSFDIVNAVLMQGNKQLSEAKEKEKETPVEKVEVETKKDEPKAE